MITPRDSRRFFATTAGLVVLATSCGLSIPEGVYRCDADEDCPAGWVCRSNGLCYPTPGEGGAEGPEVEEDAEAVEVEEAPDAAEDGADRGDAEDVRTDDGTAEEEGAEEAGDVEATDVPEDDGTEGDGGCIPEECDDGNDCNGEEVCTAEGECVQLRPPPAGTACTTTLDVPGHCFLECCRPDTCGNGISDSGEQCDDGNLVDGDGCESCCTFTCVVSSACDDGDLCNGAESCIAHRCAAGTPIVDGASCGEGLVCIHARCVDSRCGDGIVDVASGEACDDANDVPDDGCEYDCSFSCRVAGDCDDGLLCNGSEWCVVASHRCMTGTAAADGTPCLLPGGASGVCRGAACAGADCGDAVVDHGEECDDGNLVPDDGCENDCLWTCETPAECADPLACNGAEACVVDTHLCQAGTPPDDGTECDRDADAATRDICLDGTCRLSLCGDGFPDPPDGEQCDDGNIVPDDGCESDCTWSCEVDADCDDGDECSGTETCDPSGHACAAGTPAADGTACTMSGGGDGLCRAGRCSWDTCGDRFRDPGEECDDGNSINGDGCDNGCLFSCHGDAECRETPDDPCTTNTCQAVSGGQACAATFNRDPCDDRDACTSGDVCNGAGVCRGTAIDGDRDTYGPGAACGGDCDDRDADVHPGAAEACNGVDDDCSGATDDGPAMTCGLGSTRSCEAHGAGGTTCVGTEECSAGTCTWGGVCWVSAVEACNGADDDCDGSIDETYACALGSSGACTATGASGATCPGTRACGAGCAWGTCTVTATETCNGVDDDCDTLIDEAFTCTPGQTLSCTVGACPGTQTCTAACEWGSCVSGIAEVCNGFDDNCDTLPDETFDCALGSTGPCTSPCGGEGLQTCEAGCAWGACVGTEVCNGADDDCDTSCDEGFACCAGQPTTCVVGSCPPGVALCDDTCNPSGVCDVGAAPGNDACGSATPIALPGGTFSGTTCGAASDADPSGTCGTAGGPDVFYRIDLLQRSRVTASTAGSSFDTVLYLRAGSCGGSAVACDNDSGGGGASRIDGTFNAGTYYLVVDGNGPTAAGAFSLSVQVAPGNDTCAGAIDVGWGGVFYGTTRGATNDYDGGGGGCGCNSDGADVVYRLSLGFGSDVFINTMGSSFDTQIYLRRDSCTAANVDCADDYRYPVSTNAIISRDNLSAGTYYIIVDTCTAGEEGDFRLEVATNGNDDPGDRCGQPWELPPGTTEDCDSTGWASSDYSGSCGGGGSGRRDVVYYFVVPDSRTVTFTTCDSGTDYNTVLYLRRACADSGAEVVCNNDDSSCTGATTRSRISTTVDPGIYYVFVDGNTGSGNYCLNATF